MTRFIVLIGSICVGMPVGSFYSWSVFIDPIRDARPDFSRSASVHANSVVISALSIACALTGKILGKKCVSLRIVSAIGGAASAAGLFVCATSLKSGAEWLLFAGAFLNGFGMGMTYVCFIKSFKQQWCHAPGFAAGWVMMVSSAGSFVFVWICHALLHAFNQDPSKTFMALAVILFVMQCPGSFLLLDNKESERSNLDGVDGRNDSNGVEDLEEALVSKDNEATTLLTRKKLKKSEAPCR
eukprot:g1221.t1